MRNAKFDASGDPSVFLGHMASAIAEGAKSLLLLACEKNGFTPEVLDSGLHSLPVPVFGGIFPGIIFGRKSYEMGSLVVSLPFEAKVAQIAGLSSLGTNFPEAVADSLSSCPTVFVFVDGSVRKIGTFLDGVYDRLGTETKYLGGGAGSSGSIRKPCLFSNHGLVENHAQLAGIPYSCEIEVSQGWQKHAGPFLVTESEGEIIRSLDYKPAFDVYHEIVEASSRNEGQDFFDFFCDIVDAENHEKRDFFETAKNHPVGIDREDAETFICEPVGREGKSLVCTEDIPSLSSLYVLKASPESLIAASRSASKSLVGKLQNRNLEAHPVIFSCMGRSHFLQDKFAEEIGEIADAFRQFGTVIGALTLGEIANCRDGSLSLFDKSIVMGMTSIEKETPSQKAVSRISMQYALAMLVTQNPDLTALLRHFLPRAIKLVHCRSAHVWLKDELRGEEMTHRYSYPAREYERIPDYPRLLERVEKHPRQMEIVTENAAIFHIFPVGSTGILALRRNSPLSDDMALALSSTLIRLEEACLFAMRHAHCENVKQAALQDASRCLAELRKARTSESSLLESDRRLRFVVENIPNFVFWKDERSVFQGCNRNFARFSGFEDPEEIRGKTDADLPWQMEENRIVLENGEQRWIDRKHLPIPDENGNFKETLTIFEDVSERKKAEEEWRLNGSVFRNTQEGILMIDSGNRIVNANRSFSEMTGYSHEELLGMDPGAFLPENPDDCACGRIRHSIEKTGSWRGEVWSKRKDGTPFAALLNICAVRNDAQEFTHYIAEFGNITDLKNTEKHLESLAHFDPLTNLPNRTLLAEDLRKAILHADRSGRIFALAFLDLDDFKPVNDQHGHETGDKLLIEVAKRLRGALRGEDSIARLGGDEFVLLLTGIKDMSDVEITLGRLLSDLSSPYQIDSLVMRVSASIGVTVYPLDRSDADTLLRHADQAMYLAKQSGRNCFQWFDSKLELVLRTRQEKLSKLRFALERKELVLHYQPKINLKTGAVVGLEALIRWQHPEEGLVGPLVFLPLAEQSDLIIDIGNWILEEAIRQMAKWVAEGIGFPVSVNVSAVHLKHQDFVDTLVEIFARYPTVPPARLELEILETAALDDLERVRETMICCQQMGISFSLDDFGTGYSSLSCLKRLPVDTVKVDRSFVQDMKENTEDLSIIEGVISLARIFSKMVIAEGVETSEHGMLLVRLGCDFGQGYGIARPMPAAEIPKWLSQFDMTHITH